jgi:hypothetical protein
VRTDNAALIVSRPLAFLTSSITRLAARANLNIG